MALCAHIDVWLESGINASPRQNTKCRFIIHTCTEHPGHCEAPRAKCSLKVAQHDLLWHTWNTQMNDGLILISLWIWDPGVVHSNIYSTPIKWSSGTWSSSETTTFAGHPDKTSHGLVSTHLFAPKACSILMSIPQVWPHQLCAIHAVLWLQRNDWRPIWLSPVSDLNGLWFIYTVKIYICT